MMQEIQTEWNRLNPKFVNPGDGFVTMIQHAAKESWHGFFAPLCLLGWILVQSAKALVNRKAPPQ